MAKRFTDTNKYKNSFYRGLKGAYKILWDYLYHDCDHAGVWIVDFDIAQIYVGSDLPINKEEALRYFNEGQERIVLINGGEKWFIPSFIEFQYGELNPSNKAHNSVIKILEKLKIKPLTSPLQGAKDMVMVKDKEMDKELDKKESKDFDFSLTSDYAKKFKDAHELYPSTKRSFEIEYREFISSNHDTLNKEELPDLILNAIKAQIKWRKEANGEFREGWKSFRNWILDKYWTLEIKKDTQNDAIRAKMAKSAMEGEEYFKKVKQTHENLVKSGVITTKTQ